ncbi:MAG: hypothetical protein ACREQZ_05600 [Woeseiaceae bacterium]
MSPAGGSGGPEWAIRSEQRRYLVTPFEFVLHAAASRLAHRLPPLRGPSC